jgi:hypothetical protein
LIDYSTVEKGKKIVEHYLKVARDSELPVSLVKEKLVPLKVRSSLTQNIPKLSGLMDRL